MWFYDLIGVLVILALIYFGLQWLKEHIRVKGLDDDGEDANSGHEHVHEQQKGTDNE